MRSLYSRISTIEYIFKYLASGGTITYVALEMDTNTLKKLYEKANEQKGE